MKIFVAILKTGFKGYIFTSFATALIFFSPFYLPTQFLPSNPAAMITLYSIYVVVGGSVLTFIACVRVVIKSISLEKTNTEEFSSVNDSVKFS